MTVLDLPVPSDAEHAALLRDAPWRRLAIVGDSIAEGVREPAPGWPDRSWTDWITAALPGVEERNLGRRSLLASEVREQQLSAALAFEPDLVVVSAGGNDTLRREFDADAVWAELAALVAPLRASGADVLMLELLDPVLAGIVRPELAEAVDARLGGLARVTREVARYQGAMLVEMRGYPVRAEMFASDRLHLNASGHAIVGAEAVRVLARGLAERRHVRVA